MLGSGGGADDASRTRVGCAWGKFNELAPLLVARGPSLRLRGKIYRSLRLRGKIYRSCVQSVMTYGSETWPMKVRMCIGWRGQREQW